MRRVISLFLPRWPCDRLRRKRHDAPPPARPLVLAGFEGQRRVLVSIDEAAAREGLAVGMTVTHARSLVSDLTVWDATPDEDSEGLTRLALWCSRYSPLVTPDPPDGVFIDVAGSAHLFHGENALIEDLLARLAATKISAHAAVADTPGCAWAVARFGTERNVAPGRATEAIASLPVAALRLVPQIVSALHDVGIERVAQLAGKPRAGVRLRFPAAVLLRLDQAFGLAPEALTTLEAPDVPRIERRYAEPLADPEDLKRVIADLSDALCTMLTLRGVGARRLDLVFTRVDNLHQAVRLGLSQPYREPTHFAKLLNERLVLVDPGFGIESAVLTASWVEAMSERQIIGRHVSGGTPEADLNRLVDTLGVRLGQEKLFRVVPFESNLPERVMRRVPALHPPQHLAWPVNLPRPARLLERPEQVIAIAEVPDRPPRHFVWRGVGHRVARADGPERIHGEWWVTEAETYLVRDYYRVETPDGARYWLFRDAPADKGGTWWLHGVGEA